MSLGDIASDFLPGIGGPIDAVLGMFTNGANNLFRGLATAQFQNDTKEYEKGMGDVANVGHFIRDQGGKAFTDLNNAWNRDMAGYDQAAAGQGYYAQLARNATNIANQQAQGAVDYARSVADPLLQHANEAYDLAKQSFVDQSAKLAETAQNTVTTAREGLDRTMAFGRDAIDAVKNGVGTAMRAVAATFEATNQELGARIAELNAAGDHAGAARLEREAAFNKTEAIANNMGKLRVEESALRAKVIGDTSNQIQSATMNLAQTMLGSAGLELEGNVKLVDNVLKAVSLGVSAGQVGMGAVDAMFRQVATTLQSNRDNIDATKMDVTQLSQHAQQNSEFIKGAYDTLVQTAYTGAKLTADALTALLNKDLTELNSYLGMQAQYIPSVGDFIQGGAQNRAVRKQEEAMNSGGGWSQPFQLGLNTAATVASTAGLFV